MKITRTLIRFLTVFTFVTFISSLAAQDADFTEEDAEDTVEAFNEAESVASNVGSSADEKELTTREKEIHNFRNPGKKGINTFENPKTPGREFEELKVQIGGGFAIQYQGLAHENADTAPNLRATGNDFNLPTANLDIRAQLGPGMLMVSRTYLSSRHHSEAWVKDGYIQFDTLDFITPGFMSGLMSMTQIKVGMMEINYGDAHFRRTDNGNALQNPFVGNLVMDGFNTEMGAEVLVRHSGFLAMVGATNAQLNQTGSYSSVGENEPAGLFKVGYDNWLNKDTRVRLTASGYLSGKTSRVQLYSGDRAGSRYYNVMTTSASTDFRSGRYSPDFNGNIQSYMINPFIKWKGLEFFGTVEMAQGGSKTSSAEKITWIQLAGDLIYRFGRTENFYVAARYNTASGKDDINGNDLTVNRMAGALGWYLNNNVMAKLEVMEQTYEGFANTTNFKDGKFNGFMLEAAIAF